MARKKAKAKKRKARAGRPAAPREDLKAAGRAQVGRDPEARRVRPDAEDASIEDPLRDWPEDD